MKRLNSLIYVTVCMFFFQVSESFSSPPPIAPGVTCFGGDDNFKNYHDLLTVVSASGSDEVSLLRDERIFVVADEPRRRRMKIYKLTMRVGRLEYETYRLKIIQ